MRQSLIEQLDGLSSNRSAKTNPKTKTEDSASKVEAEAIEIVRGDLAIERIASELELVLVSGQPIVPFAAISRHSLQKFWEWAQRDLDQTIISEISETLGANKRPSDRTMELSLKKLIDVVQPLFQSAAKDEDFGRRLSIQMGGREVYETIPTILMAFSYVGYIKSGLALGRELSADGSLEAIEYALGQTEFPSLSIKKLWCLSFVGGMAKPELLAEAIAKLGSRKNELILRKAGFGEYLDALLIDSQKRIEIIEEQSGIFRDVDLMCKSIDRFHHLARGMSFQFEMGKNAEWHLQLEALIKRGASALNSRFEDIVPRVNAVLRPAKPGKATQIDPSEVLVAFNCLYILAATRAARESLAVNAIVDKAWKDIGGALEVVVDQVFDHYKLVAGNDQSATVQAEVAIKFCTIRFGAEYAAILKRNKVNIEKRAKKKVRRA